MKIRFMHPAIGEVAISMHEDTRFVIGRKGGHPGIELNWDSRISRRHACVWSESGVLWFEDLGSRNGSFHKGNCINGKIEFELNEDILVGDTVMTVCDEEDPFTEPTDPTRFSANDHETQFDVDDLRTNESYIPLEEIEAIEVPGAALSNTNDVRIPEPSESKPRLVAENAVEIYFESRGAFASFWRERLLKTGLFVETKTPPGFGTIVRLHVETPDGAADLTATVVHVVSVETALQFRMAPGAGFQLSDVDPNIWARMDQYADGVLQTLDGEPRKSEVDISDTHGLLDRAGRILANMDQGRFYEALEVEPDLTEAALRERVAEIEAELSAKQAILAPPQQARLGATIAGLERMTSVLFDKERRLLYDFRFGHHRIEERMRDARDGKGPSLAMMRDAWNTVYPDSTERAATLMRRAFTIQHDDLRSAIRSAEKAMELNPFFEELEAKIATWTEKLNKK